MLRATSPTLLNYAQRAGRKHGLLFTAGPLSTTRTVREAQLEDYGSRDSSFTDAIKTIRSRLLAIGQAPAAEWSALPMQGSGTMGIEAAVCSMMPRANGKMLVLRNGAYGARLGQIVEHRGATLVPFDSPEGVEIDLVALQQLLQKESGITNVGIVHCETSTGMLNPIHGIAALVRRYHPEASILVDAMSSFGAVEFAVPEVCDVLVSSSNKCIQGVPGFSVVLARRALLDACRGRSPSFTLDICKQHDGLEKTGQFNYTPPVQALMAFHQALLEHEAEGGVGARALRYRNNCNYIADRMTGEYGFELFLDRTKPSFGNVITAYRSPSHNPNWDFKRFYDELKAAGFVIYPGKASFADTFRIGSLGDIHLPDCIALMDEVGAVLKRMGVDLKAAK